MFESPRYSPPVLPATGIMLLEMTRQPDVEFKRILALLEQDPMIAARVLAVAQSARYATRGQVRSLEEALVRLGLDAVVRIFLEVVMQMRIYRAPGLEKPMGRLHRHCTATAIMASRVAGLLGLDEGFAFLCGLLHDVGMAASMLLMAPTRPDKSAPNIAVAWPTIVQIHESAGEKLCELWKLDEQVRHVVAYHHGRDDQGHSEPLAAVVALAEVLASDARVGVPLEIRSQQLAWASRTLGLDNLQVDELSAAALTACAHLAGDA